MAEILVSVRGADQQLLGEVLRFITSKASG